MNSHMKRRSHESDTLEWFPSQTQIPDLKTCDICKYFLKNQHKGGFLQNVMLFTYLVFILQYKTDDWSFSESYKDDLVLS